MPLLDDINRLLRDHTGYTGDGQGGVGPLPVGDRSTARFPINKRDLRELLIGVAQSMGDPSALDLILDQLDDKAALSALNRLGVIPLTDIGGTANAITASIPASVVADGVTLNNTSTVSFTPSASNTGSPVTLFVAGDQARLLRGEDGGDIPVGYLKASRFYIAQRFGANWKIISGGATFDDLVGLRANAGKIFANRAQAVSAGQANLPAALNRIFTQEGDHLVLRGQGATADDPLFETAPRWGVVERYPTAALVAAALNVVGVVPLINAAIDGNTYTADMAVNAVNAGMAIGGNALVEFIPPETNPAGSPTLTVSQDGTARFIQPEDGGSMPAEYLVPGRSYFLRRRGAAWRVQSGSITKLMMDQLETRARNNIRDSGLIRLTNIGGTADDVTAEITPSAENLGVVVGSQSIVRFTATATNTGPMTFTVAGDETRALLDAAGNEMEAGGIKFGRGYQLRRAGANWRIDSGDASWQDVLAAEDRADTRRRQDTAATGKLTLTNIAGTPNEITAELSGAAWMEGVTLGSDALLHLVAPGNNTGPVVLTIAGDDVPRQILKNDNSPLVTGDLLFGRSYLLQRRGQNWRIINDGISRGQLGDVAFRNSEDIMDRQKVTGAMLYRFSASGSGNAIVLDYLPNLPQVTFAATGTFVFTAPGTNSLPSPTITIGERTWSLRDVNGATLDAGRIRQNQRYIVSLRSTTEAWLVTGPAFSDLGEVDLGPVYEAIDGKAAQSEVSALAITVGTKASQAQVDDLAEVVDGLVSGTHLVGDWDPDTGAYPAARPNSDPVSAGDQWDVVGTGTVDGIEWQPGDILTALIDTPSTSTYAGNWSRRAGTATALAQRALDAALPFVDFEAWVAAGGKDGLGRTGWLDAAGGSQWVVNNPDDTPFPAPAIWRPEIANGVISAGALFCELDGVTDDAGNFQDGLFWAAGKGAAVDLGGRVLGVGSTIVLPNRAHIKNGSIRRVGSTYHTLLMSDGFLDYTGEAVSAGPNECKLIGIDLDGDWGFSESTGEIGQHDGCGLLYYGRGLLLSDFNVRSAVTGRGSRGHGIWTEYRGTQSPFGHKYERILIDGAGRHGWYHRASDAHAVSLNMRSMARANEKDGEGNPMYDGLHALNNMMISMLNIWQPGSGPGTDNMRNALYIDGAGTAMRIIGGTVAHGTRSQIYLSPSTKNCYLMLNAAIARSIDGAIVELNGNSNELIITSRGGTSVVGDEGFNVPFLRMGREGTGPHGNDVTLLCRDQMPAAMIDVIASGGDNSIHVAGRVTGDGVPALTMGSRLHPSDILTGVVRGVDRRPSWSVTEEVKTVGTAAGSLPLPMRANTTWTITGTVTATQTNGGGRRAWQVRAQSARAVAASSVAVIGSVIDDIGGVSAEAYGLTVVADTATGSLRFDVTGVAAADITWSIDLRINEVKG